MVAAIARPREGTGSGEHYELPLPLSGWQCSSFVIFECV